MMFMKPKAIISLFPSICSFFLIAKLLPIAIPSCGGEVTFSNIISLNFLKNDDVWWGWGGVYVLTAKARIAVIIPALIETDMYLGSKFRRLMEEGFIPFFKCPTCTIYIYIYMF